MYDSKHRRGGAGTHFTHFTGIEVQILTQLSGRQQKLHPRPRSSSLESHAPAEAGAAAAGSAGVHHAGAALAALKRVARQGLEAARNLFDRHEEGVSAAWRHEMAAWRDGAGSRCNNKTMQNMREKNASKIARAKFYLLC